jgi:hypothetical protein
MVAAFADPAGVAADEAPAVAAGEPAVAAGEAPAGAVEVGPVAAGAVATGVAFPVPQAAMKTVAARARKATPRRGRRDRAEESRLAPPGIGEDGREGDVEVTKGLQRCDRWADWGSRSRRTLNAENGLRSP